MRSRLRNIMPRSDALAAGASYPAITHTVTVASKAPASVTNTATVVGGGEADFDRVLYHARGHKPKIPKQGWAE